MPTPEQGLQPTGGGEPPAALGQESDLGRTLRLFPANCFLSARPSSWSPSQKCITGTRGRRTSTTSTAPTTECMWRTTPSGTAAAAPSSDAARLALPSARPSHSPGRTTEALSSCIIGFIGCRLPTLACLSFLKTHLSICQAQVVAELLWWTPSCV